MKLKFKQLAILLGGVGATGVASQMGGNVAHASTKTVKVQVKKGDTAWDIAKKHKTSLKKLVKENNLKDNGNLIYVGQTLNVEEGDQFKDDLKKVDKAKKPVTTQTQAVVAQKAQSQAVSQAPVQRQQAPVQQQTASTYRSNAVGSEKQAKEWIASRESSGSYSAQNGRYYGRYQLDLSYLHGDLSAANQERVADNYVKGRYGSWTNAQAFWQAHGWY